jgi:hypothetical protein
MRDVLQHSYYRFLTVVGWSAVAIGLGLLALSLVLQLDYSPFQHPGAAPPAADRVEVLRFDSVRWLATALAGSLCGVRVAPRRRSRLQPGPGAAVAVPLAVLVAVVAMGAVSTACWFYWMKQLPGGDRMHNALLCAGYFALPTALLLSFAASLVSRPPN